MVLNDRPHEMGVILNLKAIDTTEDLKILSKRFYSWKERKRCELHGHTAFLLLVNAATCYLEQKSQKYL